MAETVRHFMAGRMNKSLDERLVPNGEYVDAMNIRVNSTENSEVGAVENTLGNEKLTTLTYNGVALSSTARTIGYFADGTNETIYWFVHSPEDGVDMVVSYNDNADSITYHVVSTSVLNFDEDYLITGVDKIDDLLFWTDNLNPPRRINVTRSYPSEPDLTDADINVIVAPPSQSPTINLINLPGQENYLETRFISFAYRYRYQDGEYSALSQFSKLAFQPGFFSLNLGTFQNEGMLNQFNAVQVTFNTGGEDVVGVDLCFKIANLSVVNVIDRFVKIKQGWPDNAEITQVFTNKKVYTTLQESELLRLFDNVPTKAQAQTLMANRIIYGNYADGFDLIDSDGEPVNIDFEVELISEEVDSEELPFETSNFTYPVSLSGSITTEDSSITIDLTGIELSEGSTIGVNLNVEHSEYSGADEPTGFQSGFVVAGNIVLQQKYTTVYDLATSDEFKRFVGTLELHGSFAGCGTENQSNNLTDSFICAISNYGQWVKTVFGVINVNDGIQIVSTPGSNEITLTLPYIRYESPDPGSFLYEYFRVASAVIGFRESFVTGSLHSNRSYSVGIVYMDEYNRSSTVLLSNNNTVFVPASGSTKRNYIQVTIPDTQKPPFWARRYKFLLLPSGTNYETIYSNRFFIDPLDGSTWFKLEGDNQNKMRTGDPLVVKVDSSGALNQLIETTVLEVSAKTENFIEDNVTDDGSDIKEPTGLYMRLQPIGWSAFYDSEQTLGGLKVESPKGEFPFIKISVSSEDPDNPGQFIPWAIEAGDIVRFDFRFHRDLDLAGTCDPIIYTYQKEFSADADYDDLRNMVNSQRIGFNSGVYSGNPNFEGENTYIEELGSTETGIPRTTFVNKYQFLEDPVTGQLFLGLRSGTPKCKPFAKTNWAYVEGAVTVIKSGGLFVFETQPEESNSDIYFEGYQSHSITEDEHDETTIALDLFNCFSFGNGVESYKIRDALAAPFFNIGHRVSSVARQEFKSINRYASLIYSGIYNPETNLNNLNEFNLGLANFKDLEKRWGPIKKLYARQTDLLVLQEDRISYVLAGKNLLSDSAGGGPVTSVPEVLGTQIARQEEFGISFHPESFAVFGYDKFFTDAKRGVVLRLSGTAYSNEQLEIVSDLGMKEWFRQLFIDSLQTQKLGGYDPYSREYVLSSNDIQKPIPPVVVPCGSFYQLNIAATSTETIVFELIDVIGDFDVVFSTISGSIAEIAVTYDGDEETSTSQSGTISLTKDTIGVNQVSVAIESEAGAVVSVKTTCPEGEEVTIIKICVNSGTYKGKTIHNENLVVGRTIVSSDLIELQDGTGLVISQFSTLTGMKGSSVFPVDTEEVRIRANKRPGDTLDFLPGTHKLRYYESDTLYDETDIDFLIDNSTSIATTNNGNINFADYEYSGLDYIYLIYDYRLPNEIDLCYSDVQPLDACCECGITTTTTTTTTTLPYSTFALYLKTDVGTGWPSDQQAVACSSYGSIFFLFGHPGYSSIYDYYLDGGALFSNTSLTNIYNGQNNWFKTNGQPFQGRTVQIGPDGFMNQFGSDC